MEVGNVENICRLCLSTDEPRSSVFEAHEQEDSAIPLATKIQACLSIQVHACFFFFSYANQPGFQAR